MNKSFGKYINFDEMRKDIANYEKEAIKKNNDIYIISKSGFKNLEVINIFDNVKELLKYLDRRNYKTCTSVNWLWDYVGFLKDFCKDTNKYRTFDKKRVWKLQRTIELGNRVEIQEIKELKNNPIVRVFLREKKLERILNKII